jgi:hypothetical protein
VFDFCAQILGRLSEPRWRALTARSFFFMNFVEDVAQGFRAGQREAEIKLVEAGFVKPHAGNVEQLQGGHEARQRERLDGKLGDRFADVRVGLVIQDIE